MTSPTVHGPPAADAGERRLLLKQNGPRIDAIIAQPSGSGYLQREALIDTGATDILIDQRAARQLGLRAIDKQTIGGVGGGVQATVYAAVIEVPALSYRKTMQVFAPTSRLEGAPMLLGRSFLQDFIMTYDGPEGLFYFYDPITHGPA